jgi:glutamyl-tRNA synthetase
MTNTDIRVRLAPSPTGEPHIGTAYTALYNYLFAKKMGGKLILRIEDTDASRSKPEFEQTVYDSLRWMGLDWSEGPDVGGDYGPYRQSERKGIYGQYIEQILDAGHGFKCFCSSEELTEMREFQRSTGKMPRYSGRCLRLTAEEIKAREDAGDVPVIRMKIPTEGSCTYIDGGYGEVVIPWDAVDMQVIQKSDGMPTYHMANVVDDHLMKITHVARGEEWISSTPKHILLYQYLGWDMPQFTHLPLMRGADKSKLSKRKNPTSMSYYASLGHLPEALTNFLGLFFIQISEGDELMDLDELIEHFDPEKLSKAGAVFDVQKLDWLNARWLREKLTQEEFLLRALEWASDNDKLKQGLLLAQTRIQTFSELPDLTGFLLKGDVGVTAGSFANIKKNPPEKCLEVIDAVRPALDEMDEWNRESIEETLRVVAEGLETKLGKLTLPLFVAVSGTSRSLPLFDAMVLLGRAMVRQRLKVASEALHASIDAPQA